MECGKQVAEGVLIESFVLRITAVVLLRRRVEKCSGIIDCWVCGLYAQAVLNERYFNWSDLALVLMDRGGKK